MAEKKRCPGCFELKKKEELGEGGVCKKCLKKVEGLQLVCGECLEKNLLKDIPLKVKKNFE
jgi:hypothetical protein